MDRCDFCKRADANRECLDCHHVYCGRRMCVAAHEAIAAASERVRGGARRA